MEFKQVLEHCTTKDCTMLKYYSALTQCYHVFGTGKKKLKDCIALTF